MTSYTTVPILTVTEYGVPAGNYDGSSLDFVSNGATAANYYGGQGSIQTVTFRVTGFQGNIRLEATLDDSLAVNTDQAAWAEVYDYDHLLAPTTEFHPVTITGNFTYMRVRVLGFVAGTINSIAIAY
jgi:hypothetical protein